MIGVLRYDLPGCYHRFDFPDCGDQVQAAPTEAEKQAAGKKDVLEVQVCEST